MNRIIILLGLIFLNVTAFSQHIDGKQRGKPFVIGEVQELRSKVLNEKRILNIYLPEGYNSKDTTRYPVIYLLDGSGDEDFVHVAGLVQYNSFEWVDRLPKSILVGIATVDRRRDFTFPTNVKSDQKLYPTSGQSSKFICFLEAELQPFIDRGYKTTRSRSIIGQSLGGLLITEIVLKKPSLFNKYIIISPSLWWDNGSLLSHATTLTVGSSEHPIDIYIGVGKEGLTPTVVPRVMEVDANLLAEKLRSTKSLFTKVIFDYLPQENHATIMHQALMNAFTGFAAFKGGNGKF